MDAYGISYVYAITTTMYRLYDPDALCHRLQLGLTRARKVQVLVGRVHYSPLLDAEQQEDTYHAVTLVSMGPPPVLAEPPKTPNLAKPQR